MRALIWGKGKRAASEICGVPPTTLSRHFKHLIGRNPNANIPLTKPQREKALKSLCTFYPKLMGQGRRIFLPDEELMIVEMLEAAADCAFPYNADALEATALNLGKAAYGAKFSLGDNGAWRRGFERRHKHRIDKVKSSSICSRRAAAATKEVRDKVFSRFVLFLDDLVETGRFTQQQRDNLGDHIVNGDEVGGDERGKRAKVYDRTGQRKKNWRTTTRDGDHNPFHVTLMLVSMGNGTLMRWVSLIHSAPGSKKAKMREDLYENIPVEWHVRRTVSGSMTRELFQDWAVSYGDG